MTLTPHTPPASSPQPSSEVGERTLLRQAFRSFATGVTVVTVAGASPHGMTANSFASVSLDPPLVLICVDRHALMHAGLDEAEHFGVSVLADDQEHVARHFANRMRPLGAAQFDAVEWTPGRLTGVPLISGSLAHFECRVWRGYDGGDHTIFLGQLLSLEQRRGGGEALLFHGGRFRQLRAEPSEVGG